MEMKKIITLIVLISFFSLQGMAQGVVKIAPLKLINSKIAVGYEHIVNEKITLGGSIQVILPNNFNNFNASLQEGVTNANGGTIENTNLELTGFSRKAGVKITPEARYYFSGNAPRGIYGMAFLRYSRLGYGWENTYIAEQTNNEEVDFNISVPLTVAGGGLGLGVQAVIKDKVTIDWNNGLGFGAYSVNVRGDVSAPSSNAINEFFSDIERNLVGEEFLNTVSTNTVTEESGAITTANLILISRLTVGIYLN